MVKYEIPSQSYDLYLWIQQQPNLVGNVIVNNSGILCEFNHTTEQEQEDFRNELEKRISFVRINGSTKLIHQDLYVGGFIQTINKNNLSTSYVDAVPLYNGFPIWIDTKGYNKLHIFLYWRKNGGTGRHDARLIDHANPTEVFASTEATPNGLVNEPQINEFLNVNIPSHFQDFDGYLRLQLKSSNGTDDPILDGFLIYLKRVN